MRVFIANTEKRPVEKRHDAVSTEEIVSDNSAHTSVDDAVSCPVSTDGMSRGQPMTDLEYLASLIDLVHKSACDSL